MDSNTFTIVLIIILCISMILINHQIGLINDLLGKLFYDYGYILQTLNSILKTIKNY